MSEQFRLQRQPRPVGEYRISGTQHRLVEERDHAKNNLIHIFGAATMTARILFGDAQGLPHLPTKSFGVLHRLAVVTHSNDGREHFLKSEREVPAAAVHGWTRPAIASQRRNLTG